MSKRIIQIRHVPIEIHRRLKARAAMEDMTMSDYVLRELRKALDRPRRQEVLARIRARSVPWLGRSAAEVIRIDPR